MDLYALVDLEITFSSLPLLKWLLRCETLDMPLEFVYCAVLESDTIRSKKPCISFIRTNDMEFPSLFSFGDFSNLTIAKTRDTRDSIEVNSAMTK
jgi:hypothetical protein